MMPADQHQRERFIRELDRSFSVIAPAGVGKTKSIVDRVVAIATGDEARARVWLPKLVVVTYTNKAADEMHQRARNAIIAARVGLPILTAFNRAFFGTIHAFCVRLLRAHGHLAGLPTQFEPIENDDELWTTFVRRLDRLAPRLPDDIVNTVARLMPMKDLLHLARTLPRDAQVEIGDIPPPPAVRLQGVFDQTPQKKQSAATYDRAKRAARDWLAAWEGGAPYAPLPKCSTSSEDFVAAWERAFGPINEWRGRAALAVASEIATAYRAYRRACGALTFDDQIELAWELVRHPEAGPVLRREGYRIILDEAQDTDPLQFNILLELARPSTARGIWLQDGESLAPPRPAVAATAMLEETGLARPTVAATAEQEIAQPEPGRFCMVGDPQQCIYGDRADLACYQRVREQLVRAPGGDELIFSVTFRCDTAIIETTNALVAPTFARTKGQVAYTPLRPRPGVGPGCVMRWNMKRPADQDKKVGPSSIEIGRQLAQRLRAVGLERLGAARWADVAVLCPRNSWLRNLATGFEDEGFATQLHSERDVRAERPAYAWFTALMTILAEPDNGFELVGVLREVYGLSDESLARWIAAREGGWTLRAEPDGDDAVSRVMRALAGLAREVAGLPLRDAAARAIEATALVERVRAIRAREGPRALPVEVEFEALCSLAAQAESEGLSLRAFAERLRDGMEDELPAEPVESDAVQVMTIYKAKGLQWPVVVLPLLFRKIGENTNYPAVVRAGFGQPPLIAFSSRDLGPIGEAIDAQNRRELQRLLYVGLTRAQRTLIVTDDDAFFPRKSAVRNFADLLGLTGDDGARIYCAAFDEMSEEPVEGITVPSAPAIAPVPADPAPSAQEADEAVARLMEAPRRVLPYQLGEAEARAERALVSVETERSESAEAARAYGIWWHETMERAPFERAADREFWARALERCPMPERGARELALLRSSPTAERLARSGLVIRREIPILWQRDAREVVEGVIDLAVWHPREKRWWILDWKTNVVSPEEAEAHLRKIYAPQLRAYADALRAITGAEVECGVYSTATGLWVAI